MIVCRVTFKENRERLRCRIVSGQVEGSRAYGSCPSLLLRSVKLRTTRCMVERANHKQSSVLAGTLIKERLKKGMVLRSPLQQQQRFEYEKTEAIRGQGNP